MGDRPLDHLRHHPVAQRYPVCGVPAISFSGTTSTNPQMNWTGGYEGARMMVVGNPQLSSGQASFAGNTPLVQAPGANANGTPGNQLLNESAFVIPFPCSYTPGPTPQQGIGQSHGVLRQRRAGQHHPDSRHPDVQQSDMTFSKAFPLKSERAYSCSGWRYTTSSTTRSSPPPISLPSVQLAACGRRAFWSRPTSTWAVIPPL